MKRSIAGFHQDDEGDWVAELDCFHRQHMRHRPPFQDRAWVLDSGERQRRVGSPIECPLCDRAELPEDLSLVRTLGPFDQTTLPAALKRSHQTPASTWGLLRVLRGSAGVHIETPSTIDASVPAGSAQPIPPAVTHHVVVPEPSELVLELWGRP